jgi:hypothetical protein
MLDNMLASYVGYRTLSDDAAREAFLRVRVGFKPTLAETHSGWLVSRGVCVHWQQSRPHHLGFHGHGGVVHDGCRGGRKRIGQVIAPRCMFVFCISVICTAYCCVLRVNEGLVRERKDGNPLVDGRRCR